MLTRRAALQGGTATVACVVVTTAAGAVATAKPNDPILSLERRFWKEDEASADADTLEGAEAYERFKVLDKQMQDAVNRPGFAGGWFV